MRELGKRLLRAFFPRRCIYCQRVVEPEKYCCTYCEPDVPYMEDPICYRCGRTKKLCICHGHRRHFERCIAAMRYEDGAACAVLFLKEHDDADHIEGMATEMVKALRHYTDAAAPDLVTYVPMHRKEERERGYNQSALLAREIARQLGVPFCRTLEKIYDTRAQKSLRSMERGGNLLGAFDLCASVTDKRIVLVDDVITTGATLHECAKMLKIGGAQSVTALVFAATVPKEKEHEQQGV